MSNHFLSTKKWEPNRKIQTPTHLDNQQTHQVIQRPDATGYPGQFSRAGQDRQNVKKSNSPRINPDSMKTLWLTVGLIMILGFTSFLVSFNGLMDVAAWVGLPVSLRWTVPAFIDISILAYSMAAVIHKARNEKVLATWVSLAVFTLISVVANAVHAISKGEGTTPAQVIIGATIAAAAPIAVFAATEELSRLAFRSPAAEVAVEVENEELEEAEEVHELPPRQQIQQPVSAPAPVVEKPLSAAPITLEASPVAENAPYEPSEAAQGDKKPENTQELTEDNSGSQKPAEDDLEVIAQWVKEQHAQGQKVTGASIGQFIGKSPRTGSNRLNQLKDTMPELFDDEEQAA